MRRRLLSVLSGIHLAVVAISSVSFEARAEINVLEATRIAETMLLREEQVEGALRELEVTVVRGERHSDWFNFLSDFTCECALDAHANEQNEWVQCGDAEDVYDKEMYDKLQGREYLLVYFSSVDPEVDYEVGFFIDAMTAELIYVYRSTLVAP